MRFIKYTFYIFAGWLIYQQFFSNIEIKQPAGILAKEDPQQQAVSLESWVLGEYTVQPVARFKAQGRVLSLSHYWLDHQSKIAPYDIALGWKRMSNSLYLDRMDVSQSIRFYFYEWQEDIGLTPQEVGLESSNIHILPASSAIKQSVGKLRKGDVVVLSGYLVNVTDASEHYWNTSQSRSDTGRGACEILWLESIEVMPRPAVM